MEDEGQIDSAASVTTHDDDFDDLRRALLIAAEHGRVDTVKNLIRHEGANPNDTDGNGETPLFRAVANRQKGVVEFLVTETAADVNLADGNNTTPLWMAVYRAWH